MGDGCENIRAPSTAHFVLVHGACHGGWSWYKIRCLLEGAGQIVSCPDLSSSGTDPLDANTIFTFQHYNKPLDYILSTLPPGQKVILVGHSAGGHSVTEAIQNFPDKIQVAVFVGATMLRNGFQTEQDRIDDCTLASMLLRTCPVRALSGAVFPEGKDSDMVPRVYIKTLHDNVLSVAQQDVMIKRWPPSDVYSIDSDHCPMFSNPSHLFGLLLKVAAKIRNN
ncbi:hypothetical protein SOVF_051060 isoform A [Spinacia oleracea]|uniref:Methylesterase 17 isoform X2 n=1 Tax=Spinacia oleracea TaxID=3562 RepID=A0ABM3R522_SPIOL|nr:methylesterase 17-like isoform X2 [Spinacia oleracea]KNA20584.1 hypothetical protein SOVF_051060 isoform A [Spinacia oleracea]